MPHNKIDVSPTQLLTCDGSVAFRIPAKPHEIASMYCVGSLGGGTLKIELSPDGVAWFDPRMETLSGGGVGLISLAGVLCEHVRATLKGAVSPHVNIVVLS